MTDNKHQKYLKEHRLDDPLLSEFVSRGLWKEAVLSCDQAIRRRRVEVNLLEALRADLVEEVGEAKE